MNRLAAILFVGAVCVAVAYPQDIDLLLGAPRFHYELSGGVGGVEVKINLDPWLLDDLLPDLVEFDQSPNATAQKNIEQRVLSDPVFSYLDVELMNKSSHAIELSVFTDVLIVASKDQSQLRPDTASPTSYPIKLLPRSRSVLRFPIPAGDVRIIIANTAMSLTGWDAGRRWRAKKLIDSGESSEQVLKKSTEQMGIDISGDLTLGSADLDIPLSLTMTPAS